MEKMIDGLIHKEFKLQRGLEDLPLKKCHDVLAYVGMFKAKQTQYLTEICSGRIFQEIWSDHFFKDTFFTGTESNITQSLTKTTSMSIILQYCMNDCWYLQKILY